MYCTTMYIRLNGTTQSNPPTNIKAPVIGEKAKRYDNPNSYHERCTTEHAEPSQGSIAYRTAREPGNRQDEHAANLRLPRLPAPRLHAGSRLSYLPDAVPSAALPLGMAET